MLSGSAIQAEEPITPHPLYIRLDPIGIDQGSRFSFLDLELRRCVQQEIVVADDGHLRSSIALPGRAELRIAFCSAWIRDQQAAPIQWQMQQFQSCLHLGEKIRTDRAFPAVIEDQSQLRKPGQHVGHRVEQFLEMPVPDPPLNPTGSSASPAWGGSSESATRLMWRHAADPSSMVNRLGRLYLSLAAPKVTGNPGHRSDTTKSGGDSGISYGSNY